jgi:hypothetical protein
MFLLAYSFVGYLFFSAVRGWTSMISVMLFFLAAQFMFLGLIGEYVGRMYLEIKGRPLFVRRECCVRASCAEGGIGRRGYRFSPHITIFHPSQRIKGIRMSTASVWTSRFHQRKVLSVSLRMRFQ